MRVMARGEKSRVAFFVSLFRSAWNISNVENRHQPVFFVHRIKGAKRQFNYESETAAAGFPATVRLKSQSGVNRVGRRRDFLTIPALASKFPQSAALPPTSRQPCTSFASILVIAASFFLFSNNRLVTC